MKENVRERNKKFSHLVSDYVGSNRFIGSVKSLI